MSTPERNLVAFYNAFAAQAIRSTVDALDEVIAERLTGRSCPESLRESMDSALRHMFGEFQRNNDVGIRQLCYETAARICNATSNAIGVSTETAVERIGAECCTETFRALGNFVESLASFDRDWLTDHLSRQGLGSDEWDRLKQAGLDPRYWRVR